MTSLTGILPAGRMGETGRAAGGDRGAAKGGAGAGGAVSPSPVVLAMLDALHAAKSASSASVARVCYQKKSALMPF